MKRIGTLVVAVCATAITAIFAMGSAMAGAAEGSWYIAPQVNALWLDDGRVADDDAGVTLAFGRTMNADWDAEVKFDLPGVQVELRIGQRQLYRMGRGLRRVLQGETRQRHFAKGGLHGGRTQRVFL